jgi:putative membrane protein
VQLQKALQSLEIKLDGIISKVEKTKDPNEKKELLIRFLGGDPDKYSKFFSDLVTTEMEKIYPVKKYGDAMSPFYSILAIWVGGVMLVSLLRTNITRRKFPQATECQAFFGRYLIFFLLGQIQAAIIVAGDILLFKVMPVHPGLMFFAAAVASLVFTMLIFSLVLAFGDAGKAAVVVIMVLQISGSSGSYPIEILPPIFDKIYTFFPFPYAINAIREALCGMYGADYWKYLAQLLIFCAVGIAIGLFIRRPFIGVHDFMNEKLEETEVL